MFWQVFMTTFSAVFFAEMADKTQLTGLTLSARTGKPMVVFAGSVAAYIVITAISIFLGSMFGKYLRPDVIKYVSGVLFVLIGTLILMGKV